MTNEEAIDMNDQEVLVTDIDARQLARLLLQEINNAKKVISEMEAAGLDVQAASITNYTRELKNTWRRLVGREYID